LGKRCFGESSASGTLLSKEVLCALQSKNRAMGGNLMEMPSAWDAYQKYSNVKQQAHDMERRAVGDKTAPENLAEWVRFASTGLRNEYRKRNPSITPKLDALGKEMGGAKQKLLPAPPPGRDVYGKLQTDITKFKPRRPKMSLGVNWGRSVKVLL
jgi:hypothetical protein